MLSGTAISKKNFKMTKNQGIPRIESELMVGMALLRWSPLQLSLYATAIGYPISPVTIEDAIAVPMNRFSMTASGESVTNLLETMATLGIGFAHEVFGVTRSFDVRLVFGQDCVSVEEALRILLANLDAPKITLAVQRRPNIQHARSLVVLIETPYGARLLYDAGPVAENDLQAIVALLYSTWLARLMVVTECIANPRGKSAEEAVASVLDAPSLPASNLSKARTLQLLTGDEIL